MLNGGEFGGGDKCGGKEDVHTLELVVSDGTECWLEWTHWLQP